jgi:hypothetical protein
MESDERRRVGDVWKVSDAEYGCRVLRPFAVAISIASGEKRGDDRSDARNDSCVLHM